MSCFGLPEFQDAAEEFVMLAAILAQEIRNRGLAGLADRIADVGSEVAQQVEAVEQETGER